MNPYRHSDVRTELRRSEKFEILAQIDLDRVGAVKVRRLASVASPFVASALFGVVSGGTLAVYGGLCVVVLAIWYWLRTNRLFRSAKLQVEGGKLHLTRQGLAAALPLAELFAIELSEEPDEYFAIEGHGVRRARALSGSGRCYVSFRAARSSLALFEYPMTHTEAMAWLSAVRRFLRAQGWRPAGESLEDSGDAGKVAPMPPDRRGA